MSVIKLHIILLGSVKMSSVQRAFAHKLSKQHAADVRRQIASSASYSKELSKSGSSFSRFSSTVRERICSELL